MHEKVNSMENDLHGIGNLFDGLKIDTIEAKKEIKNNENRSSGKGLNSDISLTEEIQNLKEKMP